MTPHGLRNHVTILALMAMAIGSANVAAQVVDPLAVVARLDEFARLPLWPDFDPSAHPIAIYDGESTLLLRHPGPPEEFTPLTNRKGVWRASGRHAAMRWNSNVDLGGVRVATLLLTIEPGRPVVQEASILLHEVFHVFSKPRHLTWKPDEMHRYSYPLDDADNWALLLLEEEALARALEAEEDSVAAGWSALALRWRRQRTVSLVTEHLTFENALEMQEGTAVYVARLALGTPRDTTRLRQTRSPEELRWRFYDTGAALAAMLDRVDPGWKERLSAEPEVTMDTLLEAALERRGTVPAELSPVETASIRDRAEREIVELSTRRRRAREEFLSQGSRITVIAPDSSEPLTVRDFDPLALQILADGEALHTRRLILEGAGGRIEFENPRFRRGSPAGVAALTVPAGAHPLVDGVARVTVSGFSGPPDVHREDGFVTVEAEGLRLHFKDAEVATLGDEVRVQIRTCPSCDTASRPPAPPI